MMPLPVKALMTGLSVAGLLLLAELRGRRVAGLLAGLPTVTGPALFWLALDQGTTFAVEASVGAVAAGAACASFALAYAKVSRRFGWPWALAGGLAASVGPLPLLDQRSAPMLLLLLCVVGACLLCLAALDEPRSPVAADGAQFQPRPVAPSSPGGTMQVGHDVLRVALVSGGVSALVGLTAPHIGAFWTGMLSSPPLVAGLVAVHLHRIKGARAVATFLRGYIGGLIGRSASAALFGWLLAPLGLQVAGGAALLLAGVTGWLLSRNDGASASRPTHHTGGPDSLKPR